MPKAVLRCHSKTKYVICRIWQHEVRLGNSGDLTIQGTYHRWWHYPSKLLCEGRLAKLLPSVVISLIFKFVLNGKLTWRQSKHVPGPSPRPDHDGRNNNKYNYVDVKRLPGCRFTYREINLNDLLVKNIPISESFQN